MIEKGSEKDISSFRDCWKKCYTMANPKWIEAFFHDDFYPGTSLIDHEGENTAAVLVRTPHEMMFNGRILSSSMVNGAAVMPDYRNQGRMGKLIDAMLDECEHHELVTTAGADLAPVLSHYGFETAYQKNDYTLTRQNVKRITNFGCAYEPSVVDMLTVYSTFIRRFNGFFIRRPEDFAKLKKRTAAGNGKIVAYYDGKDRIRGYAVIMMNGREAVMEECIYLDSIALMKLINAALQERTTVHLRVSAAENLGPVFPGAPEKKEDAYLWRINDRQLFSRLFNQQVNNVGDALKISRKPMNLLGNV